MTVYVAVASHVCGDVDLDCFGDRCECREMDLEENG